MKYVHTQAVVEALSGWFAENNFLRFTYTPTNNVTPMVMLDNGMIHLALGNLSPDYVCDAQLAQLIAGYTTMRDAAKEALNGAPIRRARVERDAVWELLKAWQITNPGDPLAWLSDDDEEEPESNIPGWLMPMVESLDLPGSVKLSMRAIVPPPSQMAKLYEAVVEELELEPHKWEIEEQLAFMEDFARYFDLCMVIALAEEKLRLLGELLDVLMREQRTRRSSLELTEANRAISRMQNEARDAAVQNERAVQQAQIDGAVTALRLTNLTGDALATVVRENFPDIAEAILVSLEAESVPA